ncbi:MAG TPA: COX15/CtaA family protein [Lacibacter sp.]|nr:COX15/CtaA family protein [Lacibacter sp.]HMO88223.1 COX15/CtaA family protein [Lacibacter sp.]
MQTTTPASGKAVANWLLLGVFMLIIQILLGGITRLTGSGLSITEWEVVTGTLPPLGAAQWLQEFDKYKATPQYLLLNSDFTLSDFKFIYFWEWFHRLWARVMGLVFAVGFLWFLVKGAFRKDMIKPLFVLFLLGALQGAVGWIMVASGLTGDAVYVKPTRLALHFILAMVLLCYTFWFALQLKVPPQERTAAPALRRFTWLVLGVLVVQLLFGALMAGHKAAPAAATWPLIQDSWIPPTAWKEQPLLLNFIENKLTVHFVHRNLALLLFVLVVLWYLRSARVTGSRLLQATRFLPLVLIVLQAGLGILSVLAALQIVPNRWGVFEWLAQLHQLGGMFLLLSLVWMLYLVRNRVPAAS